MSDFLQDHLEVANWLPDLIEIPRLPKEFLANVAFTVIGDPFGQWVKQQIEARNQKLTTEKQLNIDLDPELAAAFNASTAVSSKYLFANKLFYQFESASLGAFLILLLLP